MTWFTVLHMLPWWQSLLGLALGILIASIAYRMHALSRSGMIAAALMGAVIFGLGGLAWSILLLAFFITSSLLSRLFKTHKAAYGEKHAKGSQRDAAQVMANGGVASLLVLAYLIVPVQWSWLLWLAYAASLAEANADTWATELGILNRGSPRLISTGKPVLPGTSGGISLVGTLAAAAGSVLIASLAAGMSLLNLAPVTPTSSPAKEMNLVSLALGMIIFLVGVAGSLFDSYLGATVQVIYFCPTCNKETERYPLHSCGSPTKRVRGWRWLNNDWVNVAGTLAAVLPIIVLGIIVAVI